MPEPPSDRFDTKELETRPPCPECGAPPASGMTCFEQLAAVLGWESVDPELAALHFYTVAAYNLQHPAPFTDEALEGLRITFREAIDEGLSGPEVRRRVDRRLALAGKKKVLKAEADRRPVRRTWQKSLADVYLPDRPQGAAERVRAWATAVRAEL